MDEADKRNIFIPFKLPPPDLAALDELLPGYGTRSRAAREVILGELGVNDVARRSAPRRSARPRVQHVEAGKSPVVTIVLSARETAELDKQRGDEERGPAARGLLLRGLAKEGKS